jgi:FkbM family methyltransferase
MSAPIQMTAGDMRFTLWIPDPHIPQAGEYRDLASAGETYEPVMLACLTRLLRKSPGSRFMDIGAHLGYYACYVSALFDGREEVHAIESNPLYANAAREAARLNGFSRMRVFQAALSDRVEQVQIDRVTVSRNGGQGSATMSVTLDSLCEREQLRPSIIKMDVHGAEGKIILGAHSVLANVECLLLEMHMLSYLREFSPGVTRTALLDALETSGLTLYHVAAHRERLESESDFQELLAGRGFCYRRLDRKGRRQMLFDGHDILVLGLRHGDIGTLLGQSISPANG